MLKGPLLGWRIAAVVQNDEPLFVVKAEAASVDDFSRILKATKKI